MFDQRGGNGLIGRSFSGYRITEFISRGGMGLVYKAHQESLNRPVAIKVLYPHLSADDSFRERFVREAQAAAALAHPNIVRVIDFGSQDDFEYMVMDYVDGESLRDLLLQLQQQGEHLPVERTIRILNEVGAALAYAHDRGFVHRDVKPGNVLLTSDGRALLSDFGVVKAIGMSQMTHAGAVIGTPDYAAPEQSLDAAAIGPGADQYSLGIVAYEMLTGRIPFQGQTPTASWQMHMNEPPPPPSEFAPWIPAEAEAALLKALAKQPADRHPDVMAFVERLSAGLAGSGTLMASAPSFPVAGQPPVTPPPAPPSGIETGRSGRGRMFGAIAAGVLAVLLVCGLGGYLVWGVLSGDDEKDATPTIGQVAVASTATEEPAATDEPAGEPTEADPTPTDEPVVEPSPAEPAVDDEPTAAEPTPTEDHAPQMPTIAAPIFRPTPTAVPVPAQPTPTVAGAESGDPEDFGELLVSSDLKDWAAGEIDIGSGFPSEEGYHLRNVSPEGLEIWTGAANVNASDMLAQVDLRLVAGGAASYACLVIRANENIWTHGYSLCVNGDGYSFGDFISIDESNGRIFESLLSYEQRPQFRPATEWNTLAIGIANEQMLFWINNEVVGAATHFSPDVASGTVAFVVYGFQEEPTEWVFTNLEAWSIF